jgi:hypothetical protein
MLPKPRFGERRSNLVRDFNENNMKKAGRKPTIPAFVQVVMERRLQGLQGETRRIAALSLTPGGGQGAFTSD